MDDKKKTALGTELKQLGRHGATYGIAQVLNRLVGFIFIPLYTHYLSTADYGILQLVGITVEVVGIVVAFGIADAIYRFYYEANEEQYKISVVSTAFFGVLIITTPVIALVSFFSDTIADLILVSENQSIFVLIALGNLWLNTIIEVFYAYLRVKERSIYYLTFSVLKATMTFLMIIYLVVYLQKGLLGIFLGNFISAGVFCSFSAAYLFYKVGFHFSFPTAKNMVRYGLPIIPGNLAALLINVSDRYFIRAFLSVADVGIYTLGYRLGNVIHYFIRVPFMQIWGPRRFALYKKGADVELFAKITTYFVGLMVFAGLGVSVFVHDVIKIIAPPEYWNAASYTPVIALSYILLNLDQHVGFGILIAKKTEYWSGVNLVTGAINVILNFVLIAKYGTWGAVAATLVAMASKAGAFWKIGRRYFVIPFEWHRMGSLLGLAVLIYVSSRIVIVDDIMLALGKDCVAVLVYLLLVWVLIANYSEKQFIKSAFFSGKGMVMNKMSSLRQDSV